VVGNGRGFGTDWQESRQLLISVLLRQNGKSIRRRIERRFDAILHEITSGDAADIMQLPHARWLLDNSHLVRLALQQIEIDLPAAYYRQLPSVLSPGKGRVPRVFTLVEEAINQSGLPLDCDAIERFAHDYPPAKDTEGHLTLGELWAIPIALRITLLTRLCEAAEFSQEESRKKIDITPGDSGVTQVAGCITSLRTIATFNWPEFVERASLVEQTLRQDPSGFYPQMDFTSRDRYRSLVEQIARRSTREQCNVAQAALELAHQARRKGERTHRQHVGYYLIDKGRRQLEEAVDFHPSPSDRLLRKVRQYRAGVYVSAISTLALLGSDMLLLALRADNAGTAISLVAALVALIPLLSVSSGAVNFAASLLIPPRRLPILDFTEGIPTDQRAIVVVPMLLSSIEDIAENLHTLEHNFLGNADSQLNFALLSDFTDAPTEETARDQPLLDRACAGIDRLNERYQAEGYRPFLLFHRKRIWNDNSQQWMGWERKRGKLEEFNELLRGSDDTSFVLQYPEPLEEKRKIRYVITLDADSYMPTGVAARLVGAMAHPLNHPRFDEKTGRVSGGYTILQPRLETNPVTGADTVFARIFAGDVMLDLYTHAVSDVYQDVFGEAVYAGKGIYNLDAFHRSVAGKVQENTVLSHDLLEGLLGRSGLATDIVLLENYPSNYLVYLQRLHRWIRGDWQLLPWLFSGTHAHRVDFDPGLMGRWKLFDNLRRSLFTPAIVSLLLLGWLGLSGNTVAWTLIFALFPGLPILLRLSLALRTSLWRWGTIESSLRNLAEHAGADVARWLLALVFLPAEAYVASDAVLRTSYRVLISHRRLLEWSTAAQVSRNVLAGGGAMNCWRKLWFGPAAGAASLAAILIFNPQALVGASALLSLWMLSPLIALQLGQHREERQPAELAEEEVLFLRGIARDTWQFFERFVGPGTQWLPPDNVQEYPQRTVAERTSPTNIGMMLLATLTAYDLGYLGQNQLLTRLTCHLKSVRRMPKHRGHLYNWYSTRDLHPLEPLYVSTVDSGNFVAALITVHQALEGLPHRDHAIGRTVLGLGDELAALKSQIFGQSTKQVGKTSRRRARLLDRVQDSLSSPEDPLAALRHCVRQYCGEIDQMFLQALEEVPDRWSAEEIAAFRKASHVFRHRIHRTLADWEQIAPWLERLETPPPASGNPEIEHRIQQLLNLLDVLKNAEDLKPRLEIAGNWITDLQSQLAVTADSEQIKETCCWLNAVQKDILQAQSNINARDQSRRELVRLCAGLIEKTDFRFLYDRNRNLFRIGYNASTAEPDSSYYDLLASEARIASFVAIAKGDVPAKHWMFLGRPLTRIRGLRILLSWSATAFEYLMPRLIMKSPASGLINQSCAGVVREQIRFGRKNGIPWGVSESGYAQLDVQGHYQYYAFGIPNLGLKWDQGERLVVSPYASALALPYAGRDTVHNLRRFVNLKASGQYGLYEALDFGDAHKPQPARPRVVQSYMTHHQGMILVAIGNSVCNDELLKRFHRHPNIASVEYLLYERLPQRVRTRPLERLPAPLKKLPGVPAPVMHWQVEPENPELALLSNGRLSCRISSHGGGALYWRGMAVTRWDPLAEGPAGGTRVYLRDLDDDRLWSLGAAPPHETVETIFAPHTVEFRARREEMLMRMSVVVAPTEDVEIRRITLTNDGGKTRHVMLSSYCEPVLSSENSDRRHPAFSKLFLESLYLEDAKTLLFRRRPREPDEPSFYFAHCALTGSHYEDGREIEFDRAAFLGRNACPGAPAALTNPMHRFGESAHPSLDPCAAIALTLHIPPRSTVECAFLSSVGDSRAAAMDALQPYLSLQRIGWTLETARLQSERELTGMHVNSEHVRASFRLLARIVWPATIPHVTNDTAGMLHRVQDALWSHGISGDRPIVTLRVDGEEDLGPADSLLQSVSYLSRKDFAVDTIFLDETKNGYASPVNDRLRKLVEAHSSSSQEHGGVSAYVVPVRDLAAGQKTHLIAAARIYIDVHGGTAASRLNAPDQPPPRMPAFVPQPSAPLSTDTIAAVGQPQNLLFRKKLGGLLTSQDAFSLSISNQSGTPAPWCNVLANPDFGTLVSESGSMWTWWGNSSENRLTPWSNDPVLDGTGEAVYIRDEETGKSWSLTPGPMPDGSPYQVTHAIGNSRFEHNSQGLEQDLLIFVDAEDPVKTLRIRLANKWPRTRRLTVTYAVQWLLGNNRNYHDHLLLPERDSATGALLVRNGYLRSCGEELAFVASSLPAHGVSCDGVEFFGKRRSWAAPASINALGLSDRIEPSAQPCAVYQVHIDLPMDESCEFHFVLGAAKNRSSLSQVLARTCQPQWAGRCLEETTRQWQNLLGAWQVETPDPAVDAMLNKWLLYQVVASRLWGRTGFYQASGGFGFRDQLQDVLALLDTKPDAVRTHIITAASRQFEQGDVLHWWHDAPLRGVRTRCSDDLLWLAYAVTEYIEVTGERSILHDTAPFLIGEPLRSHEQEHYAEYQFTQYDASIYEHCFRAIDARIEFGLHGLPFIGSGDWNDGLNRVGMKGRGESVWMAWFLVVVCQRFAPLCRFMKDGNRADYYRRVAADLLQRAQKSAWTGSWYLRGYFDDGTPLGAPGDSECEIDLNAQTWAVMADRDHPAAEQAMQAVEEKLVDNRHRLIKLLAPPFANTTHDPGYIKSYPPGVRENGGQYTHAAVWAAWAAVDLGKRDDALRWFDWLNPFKRGLTEKEMWDYRLEPYVTAGDIYGVGALSGRGGWSWYTGSAAWLYRFGIRMLLGLQRQGERLYVRPCLPDAWPAFKARLRYGNAEYELHIHSPAEFRQNQLFMVKNGDAIDASSILLESSGRHVYDIFASAATRQSWLKDHAPDSRKTNLI